MTQQVPPGTAQIIHSLSNPGDPEPYALTYGVSFTPDVVWTAAAVLNSVHDAFTGNVMPIVNNSYRCTQSEMRFRLLEDDPMNVAIHIEEVLGGSGTEALPQNCAYLVHKRSALAGRRHRGRLYIPGVAEGTVDRLGTITSSLVTSINTALSAWLTALQLIAAIDKMVLLHTDGVSETPLPTDVTSLNLDGRIATQRGRLRR